MTDIGVGMLGYAFMGKAHINAYKKLAYMVYPPPAQPRLVAIAGWHEHAVREAAHQFGFSNYYTDWALSSRPPCPAGRTTVFSKLVAGQRFS